MRLLDQFARPVRPRSGDRPVLGRERELEDLVRVLCRREKNNPALVGPPGVGKTAIVEELGRLFALGRVPVQLQGKRLYSLGMADLVAGTKYRGEFEQRVRDLLAETEQMGDVILFLDEMHTLVGAGGSEGAIDAANLLKPALSRGRLQLIGATTEDEYRRVEADAALERRFRRLRIEPSTPEQTHRILLGLCPGLERHHRVCILPSAVEAAVELSVRYLPRRCLPDPAVDLLDEASAEVSLRGGAAVDRQAVAGAAQRFTGVPLQRLEQGERGALLDLERRLSQAVFGQEEAVRAVAAAVRRGRSGLSDGTRPCAAILLTGPTGVGKTALCKTLAETVYGSSRAFIRLDMSEYAQPHTAARLLGAPPGYAGWGEGGELTEKVRARPYSLILFDELEKADPSVTALLLQILEDGRLTDSRGREADFRNTLVVMTSNAEAGRRASAGFAAVPGGGSAFCGAFSPELLGRMDAVVRFRPLSEPVLRRIAGAQLKSLTERARRAGLELEPEEDPCPWLAAACVGDPAGARALRRLMQSRIEDPLAELILSGAERAELLCPAEGPTLRIPAPAK